MRGTTGIGVGLKGSNALAEPACQPQREAMAWRWVEAGPSVWTAERKGCSGMTLDGNVIHRTTAGL